MDETLNTSPDKGYDPTYEDRVLQWLEDTGNAGNVKGLRRREIATEIVNALAADVEEFYGSGPENREKALKDTIRILAGSGSGMDQPSQQNVDLQADPISMFNGQFFHEVTDIRIDGAGIGFDFKRTYKNQVNYRGPMGFNWDHDFNLWLRVTGFTILRSSGRMREDLYTKHPRFGQESFNYWVPPAGQHGVILENSESYILRFPSGTKVIYAPDPGEDLRHRVMRLEDRHGNGLDFGYQDGNLTVIRVNHPDRIVRLHYDLENRIIAIEDYAGRTWWYHYDDYGDLAGFTVPATDRYPDGLTTCYEYSSVHFSGALQHNLTRIIDPVGMAYLENEYGTAENLLSFNRVVRQRMGGGDTLFEYEDVIQEFAFDYTPHERPSHQTVMTAPNGHVTKNIYNRFGNLLLSEENALIGGRIQKLIRRFCYNIDGSLTASLSPEGRVTQHYYGRDHFKKIQGISDDQINTHDALTMNARMAFGNLLTTVRRGTLFYNIALNVNRGFWGDLFPDVSAAADPADIITKFTWGPDYQQPLTVSDPRYTKSGDPDHTESPAEHARYQETLTRFDYTSDSRRLLSGIRYPAAHLPDGTHQTDITERFEAYDARGRLLRSKDPAEIVSEMEYYGSDAGIRQGYLKHRVADPEGLNVRTGYEVNELGITTAVIHPRAYHNAPSGQYRTVYQMNAHGQVDRTVVTPPFSYETLFYYDRNGNLEMKKYDLRDEKDSPLPGGSIATRYAYDEQFNLVEESTGGSDFETRLRTHHRYNRSQQRIRTILPKGNQIWFAYNERMLLEQVTRAACTQDQSTNRIEYGPDGLKMKEVDGLGYGTRYEHDALGRLSSAIDALGNITRIDYDKAGNVTVERFFERRTIGSYYLMARTENIYDEPGRLIIRRENLFKNPPPAADPFNDYRESPGPGTVFETRYFYDKKGRTVKIVDAEGSTTAIAFDALDRVVKETDALGNVTESFYDPHGNLIRQDIREQVYDPDNGNFIREEVFTTLHEYDQLDRRTASTDSSGNTTRYFYDSRGLLVRRKDPLGNVRCFEHDILGRLTGTSFERTATGLGSGAPLPPAVSKTEYDPNGNSIATIDAGGNRTGLDYDAHDRLIRRIFPDGTHECFAFDANSSLISHQDGSGLTRLYDYDVLNRLKFMKLDQSELSTNTSIPGAAYESYQYDGLDRVVWEKNDFATIERQFDSQGRVWDETQTIHVQTPETLVNRSYRLQREFDALGNPVRLTYPGGRNIHWETDALYRIRRIVNVDRGIGYPGSDSLNDPYDILIHHFCGKRLGGTKYGNGASVAFKIDAGGRTTQIKHTAPGGSNLLTLQHLYDGVGNMRHRNEIRKTGHDRETFLYNSLYWLTRVIRENSILQFDPETLEPGTVPSGAIPGQQTLIDNLLGSLDDDLTDFNYAYDLTGNRIKERPAGGPPLVYVANNLNQYTGVGPDILKYDPAGNLRDDGRKRYEYDHGNQLVRVEDAVTGQESARLFYDTRRRRVVAVINGTATHYVYDGGNVLEEYQGASCTAQYVTQYGLDSHCQIATQGVEHWYHKDLTRSTRLLTDARGKVVSEYRYDPFGRFLEQGNLYNPYAFSGRRFDESAGSYDFRARQYSAALGRFLQRDMVSADNLYDFLKNNPLTGLDPLGLDRISANSSGIPEIPEFKLQMGDYFYFEEEEERTWWSRGGNNLTGGLAGIGFGILAGAGAAATLASGGLFLPVLLGGAAVLGGGFAVAEASVGASQLLTSNRRTAAQDRQITEGLNITGASVTSFPRLILSTTFAAAEGGSLSGLQRGATYGMYTDLAISAGSLLYGLRPAAVREIRYGWPTRNSYGMTTRVKNDLKAAYDLAKTPTSRFNVLLSGGTKQASQRFAGRTEQLEWSHFIPESRYGHSTGILGRFFNRPWNGKHLWETEHMLVDAGKGVAWYAKDAVALQMINSTHLSRLVLRAPDWVPPIIGTGVYSGETAYRLQFSDD